VIHPALICGRSSKKDDATAIMKRGFATPDENRGFNGVNNLALIFIVGDVE
jgi:hypothetical protein